MTVKRRWYSSTMFSLFMNASQIQQEVWTYFLCFLSIKTQHSLCVIGWLLTFVSNCINNVHHLSWQYLQLLDRWVQMYLSSARAKVPFLALDPVTYTSSDKHAFFSIFSRRVLIFPSVARWHKVCRWNKIGWSACTWLSVTSCNSCKLLSWMFGSSSSVSIALECHEGVRGCRFAVVEIDKSVQNSHVLKIPGISFLNNFVFFDYGIRAWKEYQIGEGHFYPYSSLTTNAQGATAIKVLNPLSSPSNCSGASVAGHSSISPGLFSCEEEGCVKMFSTYKELQHHLDAERHLFVEEQDTAYHVMKKKWASISYQT